jgi:hypothetical protein
LKKTKKFKYVLYLKLFYVSYFKFLCNYFIKFVVHKINSKIIKSEMVVLTIRGKVNVANTDVVMN